MRELTREEAALRDRLARAEAHLRDQLAAQRENSDETRTVRPTGLGNEARERSLAEVEPLTSVLVEAHRFLGVRRSLVRLDRLEAEDALEAEGPGPRRDELSREIEQMRALEVSYRRELDQLGDRITILFNEMRRLEGREPRGRESHATGSR